MFWLVEIMAYCAVDGFAFISGYTASNKPQKYSKIVEMWFQAFFYSFVLTVIFYVVGIRGKLELNALWKLAFPVTNNSFWYFTAYVVLFFAIPILNKFIFALEEGTAKKIFLITVTLFSVVGIMGDPFRTRNGYSAIWLLVLYLIGALAKQIKLFEKKRTVTLLILWCVCIFSTWWVQIFMENKILVNYISPTILLSGIILVVLFSRLRPNETIVRKLSPLAFGVYLFQMNTVIWKYILKGATSFIVEKPIVLGVCYIFGCAALIFVCGLLVEYIRIKLAKVFRIPFLSEKIVNCLDKILERISICLK